MNPTLVFFGTFVFAWAIFLLWHWCHRGPTIEEVVAQRGPLARIQVFPELRLPDDSTKAPGLWAEVIVKIICGLVLLWAVSGPIAVHVVP